jgi:hypothetical protein
MGAQRWMMVLWPAFLVAGVLEMVVFALIDPADMHWQGAILDLSRPAVYTTSFFVFWAVVSCATFMTSMLGCSASEVNAAKDQRNP